jgi:hypothetical protein
LHRRNQTWRHYPDRSRLALRQNPRSISTPAIKDGLVYESDFSGFLHCLDAKTGAVYWVHDMFAAVWGSPVWIDGKIYLGDEDGDVTILQAGKTKKVLAEMNMGSSVYSTPVPANGALYITNRNQLYALAEAKPAARDTAGEVDRYAAPLACCSYTATLPYTARQRRAYRLTPRYASLRFSESHPSSFSAPARLNAWVNWRLNSDFAGRCSRPIAGWSPLVTSRKLWNRCAQRNRSHSFHEFEVNPDTAIIEAGP